MKNSHKNSFIRDKLYISLNSSICKNPILNLKRFHPIKTIYSPTKTSENNFFQNETEHKDIDFLLNERKKGSYKISSKRNFKTIIFQNWNTKNNVPTEIGNCLNFPVIMDRKQILKNTSPTDIIEINNLKYEYYYPVSNRKDLMSSSEKKDQIIGKKKNKKFNSNDKGWKLITNYFYQNKKEREKQKRQLLKMKLTAKNLSVFKNKENLKEEESLGKDNDKYAKTISNEIKEENNKEKENNISIKDKMNKTYYNSEKVIKENIDRRKSKKSLKVLDLEKVEEKRSKKDYFKNIHSKSNNYSSTSEKKIVSENIIIEKKDVDKITSTIPEKKNINLQKTNTNDDAKTDSTLDKSIDWETFDKYKELENNQFLYAIKRGKPLSYHLTDFKELKRLNQIEIKEKYYKHKLTKINCATYTPKHSDDIFIINYMTISTENVIIYIDGKPENYNVNEFKSLYLNYKTLTNIPIFKYWTKSKIFKLWLNYVQRQRRKKYEKKLKEKLHILDAPIIEGIINIKKKIRQVKEIKIFRFNSKEAQFPNQFIIDYQRLINGINKEFESYRSGIKEIIKNMCEEEVHNFMVAKKMIDTKAMDEDAKLLMKIESQKKEKEKDNNQSNNNKDIKTNDNKDNKDKDNNKEIEITSNNNINSQDKDSKENINNDDKSKDNNNDDIGEKEDIDNIEEEKQDEQMDENDKKFNYKLYKQRQLLKNIHIPDDLYKSHITKEEKFKKQLNNFIKNETNYAQLATKRNFYCIILRIIRIIDHFFNESKKEAIIRSLSHLKRKVQKFYEFYKNNLNIYPLLKISVVTIGNSIKYMPEFNNLEELFFEKFIQENIFNFVNKKNFIDPQEFPIYMTCYEDVFEKSFDQNASLLNRIKNDDEIINLINDIKDCFYKIGDELNIRIDELREILNNFYKYSKVDFKDFEENCTPEKIQKYLDYVYAEKEKTIKLNKINNIGLFELNIEQLLELISKAPNMYLNKVKMIAPKVLRNKQINLINLLNKNIEELTKEVKNVEGFIKLKHSFEDCKDNRYKIDELEAEINDYIEVINNKNNRMSFDNSNIENQSTLTLLKLQYEDLFQKISYELEYSSKKYKDYLTINIKSFDKELKKVSEQLNNDLINKYCTNYNDVFVELNGLNIKFKTLKEKKEIFLNEANELELEEQYIKNLKRIDQLINEFELKKEIWENARDIEAIISNYKTKEVTKLDIKFLEKQFNQCIELCENSLENLSNFSVSKTLIDNIIPYKKLLEIIKVIQNPIVINNENKFDELKILLKLNIGDNMKYLDIYTGTFNEKFTLEALEKLNIGNITTFIEFNDTANEEERLRLFIKNKYDEMNIRKLKFKFVKNPQNTMTYITMNKNVEDNEYEFIENNIMLLRKESLNPCAWVINSQLNQLLNYYEKYRQFLNLINIYNKKIKEIDGVLLSNEFVKEYPSENKKLMKETELRYLIKLLQDNKYLSKFIQDSIYNKIITCTNALIDTIEKNIYAIHKFIDKRRREFPQYYIMNNNEVMYLYNHKKENNYMIKIIKRLYPWIKDVNLSYITDNFRNDEYIRINTVDNELILLKNVKGLKDLKDYIDIIYVELAKKMKEHFKIHKKNNEVLYKNKSTKKINDILLPLIHDVNKNLLIQEIFICIYYSVMEGVEKSLKSDDVFDKLFELYNTIKYDIMIEIIKFINNDEDGVNKIKYFCLLSLINYLVGLLENLMNDDVQSPSDFSFIKYLFPKIESDTLMFYILGNLCSIEYGYEYIGVIKNYLPLFSNEKIFVQIMTACAFSKKPIILNTNYIKEENDINLYNNTNLFITYDNISILGSFLGKNIKEYSCNKNTNVNIFKNMLCSYNKYGPWIRFNNIYCLNNMKDFEIISNQIIEVYYQLKHSEEDFISMNNGHKILITNKNFNVIVNFNDEGFNKIDKNIIGKNVYEYYRTINYIEINMEFYIQYNLINIGFLNYELMTDKILFIFKYIFCKIFCNMTKYSFKLFIYNNFNIVKNRILNNKNYKIKNQNKNDNNKNLIPIKEYENNIVYDEIIYLLEIFYKQRIDNNFYVAIQNNLDKIFNIKKEVKNSGKENNMNINNGNCNLEQIKKYEKEINEIISPYEISNKTNYYDKIIQLLLNFDNFNSFVIFGPSLSGKTTLFHIFLSLIQKIKNTDEHSLQINSLSIYPKGTPDFFDNYTEHKIFRLFNENKMLRINNILSDFYENGNKSQLFYNEIIEIDNKKDNLSINSNGSENSEKIKQNLKKCEKLNVLSFNGEISNYLLQYLINNNEFLLLNEQVINKLFFETTNLNNINQSLFANNNIFYMYISNDNENGLTWENIVNKYINTECTINNCDNSLSIKLYIKGLFYKYFNILKDFINTNIHSLNNNCINSNYILFNLINYFDSFLNINIKNINYKNIYTNNDKKIKKKYNEESVYKKYVLYIFIFSYSLVMKNFINISYIAKIEQVINDTFKADDVKSPIFDYYVNPIKKGFEQWTYLINNEKLLKNFINIDNIDPINNNMIEPLYKEKVIILYIISNLINNNKSLYLNYIHFSRNSHIINNFINDKKYKTLIYNTKSTNEPHSITNYFNEKFCNIHRNIYGDKYGRKITIFIDDINIDSSMNDFFTQLIEMRYYYDKNNTDFNFIYNFSLLFLEQKNSQVQFPLNDNSNNNFFHKLNILNCYTNYNSIFLSLYKTHLENKFKNYYINNFSSISTQYINLLCKLYSEISGNKDNSIQFNLNDIEQIIINILKIDCSFENESRYLFDKMLTRFYFYNICRISYDSLYEIKEKDCLKQLMCTTYNKIFKKEKINVEDIFDNNEFLNGKLSDYIFTHIDINNNGIINKEKIFEYKKIEFYKNFISLKIKEFNNGFNNNAYLELIINDNDYEYLQNILYFCENNLKNKNILILLEGNNLFKDLIFKFSSFLCGGKVIECKKEILSKIVLNKIFEEIVINNKTVFYYIKDIILLESNDYFEDIKSILNPDEFLKQIDLKMYDLDKNFDIENALKLIGNNLKIVLDIQNYKNIKEIKCLEKYYNYINYNCHIIYQSNWIKKDYRFYLDYSFSKSNAIKDIKHSSNYVNIKKNLFEIIYNTYLFSCELINKTNNKENIILLNDYIIAIHIFLNKYERNYKIIKEKYLIYENCNPTHKIMGLTKIINDEIHEFEIKKEEIDKNENNLKKQKQSLFLERQKYNRLISDYEKNIEEKNLILSQINDELETIIEPILKNISKYSEECLSYNDLSFNEVKYSYENSNLGKLLLSSIYILISDNHNEMINSIWDFAKKNLNIKMLHNFFEKKVYINNLNDKLYNKILENILNNKEFKDVINNLNNDKYSKAPYISIKKFSKYFYECYKYNKYKYKLEELNKKIASIKKDLDNANDKKKIEIDKLNENKSKNMEIEANILSLEKEKNNILFNIKCHNDLMFVTKQFFEHLENIIPELMQKRKLYHEILSHFISYNLFISLYYSFAPNFDRKNRIILQKYIYNQINKYNKNEIKEFTFLEIYYFFLDNIHSESVTNKNNKLGMDTEYSRNINLILALYKYFDSNKLSSNDEKSFILENILFIDFFKNKSIYLKNNKNPGISNLLLLNVFKDIQNTKNDDNIKENNPKKAQNNKNNNTNIHTINISNDIIINNENSIYHFIEINLNNNKIEKDLEYISNLLNEGHHSRNKRYLYFIINNCNKDNIYLFDDLINNSDNKKRSSLFYLGNNKISMSNQVIFRVLFSSKTYDKILYKSLSYTKLINFNTNSKMIQRELEFILENISDENFSNAWKENKMKLIKLSLQKEIYYKKICEIINKYEYETTENNYINNKQFLNDIENEIKNNKNNNKKFNKAYKNLQIIKDNLEHLTILCIQSSKIYKLMQKYYSSFSIQEFIILLEKFYQDNKFDEIDEKEEENNRSQNNHSSYYNENEQEEDEESIEKEENDNSSMVISYKQVNHYIKKYSIKDLSLLLNYLNKNKFESLFSKDNLFVVNNLRINLFIYYLRENNQDKKINYNFYKKLISQIKEIQSKTITVESKDYSPSENIQNENWNKFIYLSNKNNNIYSTIIKDIKENKLLWDKLILNSTNEEICNKIVEIINQNSKCSKKDNINNNSLDILIIISFICPFRFLDVKEYLLSKVYSKNIDITDNHYTLKGFFNSMENEFNNNSQKPLLLMEINKENLEQKIEYIKTIFYPKLLTMAKFLKVISSGLITKSSAKISVKLPSSTLNNNLLNISDKAAPNNNIVSIENKENSVKYMLIKDNTKNINYDNIMQFVKTGGLIIVNNISQFDNSFINQIIYIINEARSNKYLDRTFRIIFILSEPLINVQINDILLKNCIYFNVDLNNELRRYNFKTKILENIKNINNDLVLFYSNNIYRKKIIFNLIFLNCFVKEISENEFYNDIYEIEDILLLVKKYIENNDSEFRINNNNYVINYYYLIQFIIENILITRFSYIDEESRIKTYISQIIVNENNFINDKKYLLHIDNSNILILDTNEEIDTHKLFYLFNNIPQNQYNYIISTLNKKTLEKEQNKEINNFFKNIKCESKQTINILKSNTINVKFKSKDEIEGVFQEYIQNIPDVIILPLDEVINDENIYKNLLKKEKNNIFVNPLDELLIEEIAFFNNEINNYRNHLQQLMTLLVEKKYLKEDTINDIIERNNIEENLEFIKNKYDFYKNWIKEGEIKIYCLKYINNIQLLFYLLKCKYYKNKYLSINKKETTQANSNIIPKIDLDKININYNFIKTNNESIEISGISFNLENKYDLSLIDNHLTIINKKNNLNNIIKEQKTFSLFIDFIEDDDKYKYINNSNDNIKNLNHDLPLIKEQIDFNFDYDMKSLSLDFYQLKNNTFKQINEIKEKINIDISDEFILEDINYIILNGIYFYVNSDCLKNQQVNF